VEEGGSDLCARQVFTVVEVVVLAALVVVKANHLSFHRVLEIPLLRQHVCAHDYLILLREKSPLQESVAGFKADLQGRLKSEVVGEQTVRDRQKELVLLKVSHVLVCFVFRPARVLIKC